MGKPQESVFEIARAYVARNLKIVLFFSFLINSLMLTVPLYMLQVYDRVLTSRSEMTLLYLTLLALAALATLATLDLIRSRLLVRVGGNLDQRLGGRIFGRAMKRGLGAQPLRDLQQVRAFLSSPTLVAFLDAPWVPLYLLTVYILHPWLGHVGLVGSLMLVTLALINQWLTRQWLQESSTRESAAFSFAEASARNTEAVLSMGMLPGLRKRWGFHHASALGFHSGATDRAALFTSLAKFVRFGLQIAILGVGAYLAINEIVSAGTMIAASILMGRGLAPVEASISGWRNGQAARKAAERLQALFEQPDSDEHMPLPAPKGNVLFDGVYARPPAAEGQAGGASASGFTLSALSFSLEAGSSLGIIGPSAAGKSSIAKLIVGIWSPDAGAVRLDGAELAQWDPDALGPHIGYLPQDIELFEGTVAENIARFGEVDPEQVVAAASLAGADGLIRELPQGYDTPIGQVGIRLSGGQQQRIGLARAFYGRPPLVVLDEPTSNLDATGEAAVRDAITQLQAGGSTVVVIAHKPAVIGGVEKLMVVQKGQVMHFGDTAEVLPLVTRRVASTETEPPRKLVQTGE